MQLRTAIIGCGLIGNKRAKALADCPLVAAVDTNLSRARQLANQFPGCEAGSDWRAAVSRKDVDLVIVATTNDQLAPVTLAAIEAGKHVLVEKPGARNAAELEPVVAAARRASVTVKVGFNHRFHPAFIKAREIVNSGSLGPLMFIRGRYGHGGRLGMEKEWRGDPKIAGGGEMLDQGVHLIDLSRCFLGDFSEIQGQIATYFWNWSVEDNGFAMLTTSGGQIAWLHASCTEWKNTFSFEIYGRTGKLHIEGLGGSYGVERISHYQMLPQMGPPPTTIYEYPGEDTSWKAEFANLRQCIAASQSPSGNLEDALKALQAVQKLYDQSLVKQVDVS
jgi:predicted dehydrogenase